MIMINAKQKFKQEIFHEHMSLSISYKQFCLIENNPSISIQIFFKTLICKQITLEVDDMDLV